MAALFGRSGPKALVEFRAGKMTVKGNMVHSDKRKGLIFIEQGDDQLMHFKWKDRSTGAVEDDLIIFPDDTEFVKVPACTTGRVFLLKFKNSLRKMFYWMQEPKADKDEEYCKKVNDYLNNPSSVSSNRGGGSSSSIPGLDLNNIQDTELQSLLSNMSQQQLINLFGGPPGSGISSILGGSSNRQRSCTRTSTSTRTTTTTSSTTTSSVTTTTSSSAAGVAATAATTTAPTTASKTANPGQLPEWGSILSGIKVPPSGSEPSVDLASSINADVLQPLLENEEFVEKMKKLLPSDADEEAKKKSSGDTVTDIKGAVQSPQFQQALSTFSEALQSGQLAPLVREFNLGEDAIAAANAGSMEQFIKALQKSKSSASEEDKPEKMAQD